MKKLLILAFAALLVIAFSMPAAAVENVFGGYWRTRAFQLTDFSGDDTGSMDQVWVDTRTRLYYTAILNDNLKLVNKFEFDAQWGDQGYGDIGTDGKGLFEIKHSYADFNIGDFTFDIGAQGFYLARGFIFDDDAAGLKAIYKGETFVIPIAWIKVYEGGAGKDANDSDVDMYAIFPTFALSETISINPYLFYMTSTDADAYLGAGAEIEVTATAIGVDLDMSLGEASLWASLVMQAGDVGDDSLGGMLAAFGGSFGGLGVPLHGEIIYATGDDDATDSDIDNYYVIPGACYYWSEIMGYGIFDWEVSNGSPACGITDLLAVNLGVSFSLSDKASLGIDVWNASLVEDNLNGDTDLGTEIDVKLKYKLMENLNLDVVVAYLSAGDATGTEDPMEVGTRLSLSF
jgi:hypothetical protein